MRLTTPEGLIQRQILDYLARVRIPAWRNNVGRVRSGGRTIAFGKVGSSDILGILPPSGRLLAIEVKVKGGGITPEQGRFLSDIHKAGGLAMVAYCLEDVIEGVADALAGRRTITTP